MKHRCRQCNRETKHWHGHDVAHGIPNKHIAGSERYVCQICGVMTWASRPFGFEFALDLDDPKPKPGVGLMSDRINCHACERESPYENHGWICTKRAGCVEMVIHAAATVYPTIDYTALEAELATLRAKLEQAEKALLMANGKWDSRIAPCPTCGFRIGPVRQAPAFIIEE